MRKSVSRCIVTALFLATVPLAWAADAPIPTRPEDARPVPVGSPAPDAELLSLSGAPVRLSSFYGEGPVALIFYRGGW